MTLVKLVSINNGGTEFGLFFRACKHVSDTIGHPIVVEVHGDLVFLQVIALLLVELDEQLGKLL